MSCVYIGVICDLSNRFRQTLIIDTFLSLKTRQIELPRMKILLFALLISFLPFICTGQDGYGNSWILGYPTTVDISGTYLNFNNKPVTVSPLQKDMQMEGSVIVMSNSTGDLLFYSNGCYIAKKDHEMMFNGDSLGMGLLETSFCETGGNPITQGIMALPVPLDSNRYYMFYTDLNSAYEYPTGLYFPLAPLNLYYCIIDMSSNNGQGSITLKNQVIVADTLARGMIQATRNNNGIDWWIVMPESHSNCYYTIRLNKNGIDTIFKQCIGEIWGDRDATGQAVFSTNGKIYSRSNYFNGLNIFDFNAGTGILSNPKHITFGQDTFYWSGAAFSPNSRFLYITAYLKVFQFDVNSLDIGASKVLIAELNTPAEIDFNTSFNQALLAPDGNIYIGGTNTHTYLHIIQNPNCKGTDCNLVQYALEMPAYNIYGLPNIPNFIEWNEDDTCDISVNTNFDKITSEFKVFPNPFIEEVFIEGNPPYSIVLFDALGKSISKTRFYSVTGSITLTNQPTGLYYYQILVNNEIEKAGILVKIE